MAQTALTADIIAKEALRIMENEMGVLGTFYRAYEDEFAKRVNGYQVGETISIRRPHDPTVRSGQTMAIEDVIEGKVALTIDQQIGYDFSFTSADLALRVENLSERVIRPAVINIVNYMANDCLTQMYRGTPNWVGTPGNDINSLADFALGPKRLDKLAVPQSGRASALSPNDWWGMVGAASALYNQAMVSDAFTKGKINNLGGTDVYMSQILPTHTTGSRTNSSPLVSGNSQAVTYDTAKNTYTQNLTLKTVGNNTTIKAGDVFQIASRFMVNPRTRAKLDELRQFVVTADATADGSGNVTVTITPPIITSGPHQTIDSAPVDNDVLTWVGSASTAYVQNLVYSKNAFALAIVPLEMPQGAVNGARQSYKGISLRVVPVYDGVSDVSKWRLDLLYGRKLIDPRIITRLSGTP